MLVSGMVATDTPSSPTQESTKSMIVDSSSSEAALVSTVATTTSSEVKQATKQPSKDYNADVESEVREYFADIPLMAEISKCESHYRQFEKDGSIFRGKVNNQDVGAMQINEYYHKDRATKLGYDLHTLEGNMAYARVLYEEQGGQPWVSSSPCWKKSDVAKAMSNPFAAPNRLAVKASSTVLADNIQ